MIPNHELRKTCLPGGTRLPKWTPFQEPHRDLPRHYFGPHHSFTGRGEIITINAGLINPRYKVPLGNLLWNDYKYWWGSSAQNTSWSVCRFCHSLIYSSLDRRLHKKEHGCFGKLDRIYKKLLKDKLCVVCDAPTIMAVWGVPLCGKDCITRWMFNQNSSKSLRFEIGRYT